MSEARPAVAAEPGPGLWPFDVLVVDDDAAHLERIQQLLGPLGLSIHLARDAAEALRALDDQDFALALIDVRLPGHGGFELASQVRRHPRASGLPIIFVSGTKPAEDDLRRAYALRAVEVLEKPFVPEALRAKVSVFVELEQRRRVAQFEREELERYFRSADAASDAPTSPGRPDATEPPTQDRAHATLRRMLDTIKGLEESGRMPAGSEREVGQLRERIRIVAARLLSSREQERRRIARELHDELGQQLTGLKLDLAWIEGHLPGPEGPAQPLRERIALMSHAVSGTIESVRKVASALSPPMLDQLGLRDAIEWQVEQFQSRSGVRCVLDLPAELELDSERATHIFRIVQELLTNVARHAQAGEVRLSLAIDDGALALDFRDDGIGIDRAHVQNPKSLGLLGIIERSFGMSGRLSIHGEAGQGTQVTLSVPLGGDPRQPLSHGT